MGDYIDRLKAVDEEPLELSAIERVRSYFRDGHKVKAYTRDGDDNPFNGSRMKADDEIDRSLDRFDSEYRKATGPDITNLARAQVAKMNSQEASYEQWQRLISITKSVSGRSDARARKRYEDFGINPDGPDPEGTYQRMKRLQAEAAQNLQRSVAESREMTKARLSADAIRAAQVETQLAIRRHIEKYGSDPT